MGRTPLNSAWLLLVATCGLLAGCANEPPATPAGDSSATTKAAASAGAPADVSRTDSVTAADTSRDQRTKWIGNIPYDAFFDRPLETYQAGAAAGSHGEAVTSTTPGNSGDGTKTVEAAGESATAPASNRSKSPAAPTATAGDAAAASWRSIGPIDLLDAETKEIRTRLSANLQTVATYNANTEAIETDSSVLALIAAIIERHPESVNWKDRAPFVRQLAYEMSGKASGKGRVPFQSTREPFEKIVGIWDGGPAPDMEAAPLAPLGDVGDRAQIMLRFETGFTWLRSDVNTPTRLKEEKDRVVRESSVLATLGTALEDPTFDSADQESYRALLRQFVDGQRAMRQAAESDDFAGFEQARDLVQKSCDACHLEYRNSSGSDQ